MTIEIDHLSAAALLDLAPGQVGGGYFTGVDFRASFDADTLGVDVEMTHPEMGRVLRLVLPYAVVAANASRPVCALLGDCFNAAFA
jgi:hypothetical protein